MTTVEEPRLNNGENGRAIWLNGRNWRTATRVTGIPEKRLRELYKKAQMLGVEPIVPNAITVDRN